MSVSDGNSCNNTNRLDNSNDNIHSLQNKCPLQHTGIYGLRLRVDILLPRRASHSLTSSSKLRIINCSCSDSVYLLEKTERSFTSFPFLCILCDWPSYIRLYIIYIYIYIYIYIWLSIYAKRMHWS